MQALALNTTILGQKNGKSFGSLAGVPSTLALLGLDEVLHTSPRNN
jgi:hypothetical protein